MSHSRKTPIPLCECSTFNKKNLYSTLEKCASCSGIGGLYYADTSKTIKISDS